MTLNEIESNLKYFNKDGSATKYRLEKTLKDITFFIDLMWQNTDKSKISKENVDGTYEYINRDIHAIMEGEKEK